MNIFTAAMMQKNIPNCGKCPLMYAHCDVYTFYLSEECIENLKRYEEKENTACSTPTP